MKMTKQDFKTCVGYFLFLILLFVCGFIWLFASGCKAGAQYKADEKYLKESSIDPRKTVVYGADGKQKGYLKQSNIDRRKTVEYDKHGKEKGFWRQDYMDRRKTRYYKKK